MDLRTRLRRVALKNPAVLLVTAPGATRERLAVEAELASRGWPQASGPAAADLVAFAGAPVPRGGDDWAERVWNDVPAPKARVRVTDPRQAADALEHGRRTLLDQTGGQGLVPPEPPEHERHAAPGRRDAHGAHDGHRTGGTVAGLPTAERADDRDGLRLDRLHVPLGPVLPDWPAGLVVHTELQGDVVQHASVETLLPASSSRPGFWSEPWLRAAAGEPVTVGEAARRRCAAHLDSVGRFLAVAGWRDPATAARRARDTVIGGAPVVELRPRLHRLTRRVRTSWTLRRLISGVGALPSGQAHRYGITGPALTADGDAYRRLVVWLEEIDRALGACDDRSPLGTRALSGPRGLVDTKAPASRALVDVLPALLEGTEFACARLVVASLDPDLDELVPRHVRGGPAHG